MTKSTIGKLWWGGLAGIAGGFIVAGISVAVMLAFGGTFTSTGDGKNYNFVPSYDPTFWSAVAFTVFGGVVAFAGMVSQFIAWIGALVNTWRLPEKAWFVLLLVLGLVGHLFGLVMMIVYLLAGPDGTKVERPAPSLPTAQPGRIVPA